MMTVNNKYDKEVRRNAAIFNLTPEQYTTAQEVKDGRIVRDDECEFEQRQPHEWYCVVHDVVKIAGTTEPVRCDWQELSE